MWWDGGERTITPREKALIEEHSPSLFSIPLVPAAQQSGRIVSFVSPDSGDGFGGERRPAGNELLTIIKRSSVGKSEPLDPQPAALAEQQRVELPPLPEAFEAEFASPGMSPVSVFTAEQMQDYARATLTARSPTYTPQQMAASFRAGQNTERMQQAEQQGVDGYDKRIDLIARLYTARDMERAGAWSYLFAEAAVALAATGKQQVGEMHPDDTAVDAFADAMKAKMADARAKGRGGWEDPAQCSSEDLSRMLRDHVEKGDPRDVANFCMMLHQRREAIAARQHVGQERGKWFEVRGLAAGVVKNLESFATSQHKAAWCGLLDDSLLFADQIQKQASTICTTPPAQGIDLMPAGWTIVQGEELRIVGPIEGPGGLVMDKPGGSLESRLLYALATALIDGNRDAAPGVGL